MKHIIRLTSNDPLGTTANDSYVKAPTKEELARMQALTPLPEKVVYEMEIQGEKTLNVPDPESLRSILEGDNCTLFTIDQFDRVYIGYPTFEIAHEKMEAVMATDVYRISIGPVDISFYI